MIYTLTTLSGHEYSFYVKSCAELYQRMYGGTLASVEGNSIEANDNMLV